MKLSIPHWVIVLVTLLGTVAPQVGQAFPALAPAMGIVVQLATLVVGALGIVTGSALTKGGGGSGTGGSGLPVQTRTVPPKVDAVSDAASKLSKRVALGFGVAAIAVGLGGCTNGQLNPVVVSVTTASIATLACGFNTYVKDSQASPINWVQMAVDLATNCGMDVADIAQAFGASSALAQAAASNASAVHNASLAFKQNAAAGH